MLRKQWEEEDGFNGQRARWRACEHSFVDNTTVKYIIQIDKRGVI